MKSKGMRALIIYFLLLPLITSCGGGKKNISGNDLPCVKNIGEELQDIVKTISNNSNTKTICIGNNNKLQSTFSFFVYSQAKDISVTPVFNNVTDVMWVGNDSIKYKYLSGIVRANGEGQQYIYIDLK